MVCFKCSKKIVKSDKKFMYGIDKPYINLFFHKSCWEEIKPNVELYFTQNSDLVYNYIEKLYKTGKNGRKQGKTGQKKAT